MAGGDAIERACAALVLRLAWLADHDEAPLAIGLFSADATMDRDGERHAGIDAIARLLRSRPPNRLTRHVLSNLEIEVLSPTRARGRCYVTVYRHRTDGRPPQPPAPMAGPETLGEYHDEFVLEAGRWKFASRVVRTVLDITVNNGERT